MQIKNIINNTATIAGATDKNVSIYTNIYDMIRGRLAGVTVSMDNKITIRGTNSFFYSSEPLFIVDGIVVSSINEILPINVKSLNVLKGADASAYGMQGSNGVLIIKSK
jgi:TonB-dependent SusC/RagA subfamily outer membrane receptor